MARSQGPRTIPLVRQPSLRNQQPAKAGQIAGDFMKARAAEKWALHAADCIFLLIGEAPVMARSRQGRQVRGCLLGLLRPNCVARSTRGGDAQVSARHNARLRARAPDRRGHVRDGARGPCARHQPPSRRQDDQQALRWRVARGQLRTARPARGRHLPAHGARACLR